MRHCALVILLCLVALPGAATAAGSGSADIAALQVGLRRQGLYEGSVDGQLGQNTLAAIRALQQREGLMPDGVPGKATRAALGRFGRQGTRPRILGRGAVGWDVARLQFQLAWHGFPSGAMDGRFGEHLEDAVRKFQDWSGLQPDGRAGPEVTARLRTLPPKSPIALSPPLEIAPGDPFGPRGARFHTGIDYSAPVGTRVAAAGAGIVTYAGPLAGGWGKVVTIAHGVDVRTMYAHLSAIRVQVGRRVEAGETIGLVGKTGNASGSHLHFEVRVRGAAVDPLTALH